jgi:hypothetical protein
MGGAEMIVDWFVAAVLALPVLGFAAGCMWRDLKGCE